MTSKADVIRRWKDEMGENNPHPLESKAPVKRAPAVPNRRKGK